MSNSDPAKRFFYGRVRLYGAKEFFFDPVGRVIDDETGDVEFVLKTYASNVEEAQGIVNTARAMATEFKAIADDLERYIEVYDFENEDVMAADEAALRALQGQAE